MTEEVAQILDTETARIMERRVRVMDRWSDLDQLHELRPRPSDCFGRPALWDLVGYGGWSTPSGAGQHLISNFEVDSKGRTTKSVDRLGNITYPREVRLTRKTAEKQWPRKVFRNGKSIEAPYFAVRRIRSNVGRVLPFLKVTPVGL